MFESLFHGYRRYKRMLIRLERLKRKRRGEISVDDFRAKVSAATPEEKLKLFDHHLIKRETHWLVKLFSNAQAELKDEQLQDTLARLGHDWTQLNERMRNYAIYFQSFQNKAIMHEALLKKKILGKHVDEEKINKLENELINSYEERKVLIMSQLEAVIHEIERSEVRHVRSPSGFRAIAASVILALGLGIGAQFISPSTAYAAEQAAGKTEQSGGRKETEQEKKQRETLEARLIELDSLIQKDHRNPDYYFEAYQILEKLDKHDKALEMFENAIVNGYKVPARQENKQAEKLNNEGVKLMRQRNYKDAESKIKEAIKLDPGEAKCYHNLALLYNQTGELEKGIKAMKTSIELNPLFEQSYVVLAGLYFRSNSFDLAIYFGKKATLLNPKSYGGHLMMGRSYKAKGEYQSAITALDNALKAKDDSFAKKMRAECVELLKKSK